LFTNADCRWPLVLRHASTRYLPRTVSAAGAGGNSGVDAGDSDAKQRRSRVSLLLAAV